MRRRRPGDLLPRFPFPRNTFRITVSSRHGHCLPMPVASQKDRDRKERRKERRERVWVASGGDRKPGSSMSGRRTHREPAKTEREYYGSFVEQFPERFPHLAWKKGFSLTCAPRSTARRASLCSRRRLCWAISRCCLAAMLSSSLSTSTAPPPPTGN